MYSSSIGQYGFSSDFGAFFSDARLKENIKFVKTLQNGINLYDFNYKQPLDKLYGSGKKRGVLAQDVERLYPLAVTETSNKVKLVDYSKLPIDLNQVDFREKGGPVTGSSPYIVGEAGPELFVPQVSGYIIPNDKLEFRESGGSVTAGKPYVVGEAGAEIFVPNNKVNYFPDEVIANAIFKDYVTGAKDSSPRSLLTRLSEMSSADSSKAFKAMFKAINETALMDYYIPDKQLGKVLSLTELQIQQLRSQTGSGPAPVPPLTYRDRDIIQLAQKIRDQITPESNQQNDILLAVQLSKLLNEQGITSLDQIETRTNPYEVQVGYTPVLWAGGDEYGEAVRSKYSVDANGNILNYIPLTPEEISRIKYLPEYKGDYLPIMGTQYKTELVNKETGALIKEILADNGYGTKFRLAPGKITKEYNQQVQFVREFLDRMDWKRSSGAAWGAYGEDEYGYSKVAYEFVASLLNRLPAGGPVYDYKYYSDETGTWQKTTDTGLVQPNRRAEIKSLADIKASDVAAGTHLQTAYGGEGKTKAFLDSYNAKGPVFRTQGGSTGFKAFWEDLGPVGQIAAMVALAYLAGPLIGQAGQGIAGITEATLGELGLNTALATGSVGAPAAITAGTSGLAGFIGPQGASGLGLSTQAATLASSIAVRGTMQGIISDELGGSFAEGFAGAAIGQIAPIATSYVAGAIESQLNIGPQLSRGLAAAITRGTIAELTGKGDFFTNFLASGVNTLASTGLDYLGKQVGVTVPNMVNSLASSAITSSVMGIPFDLQTALQNVLAGQLAKNIVDTGIDLVKEKIPSYVHRGGDRVELQEMAKGGPVMGGGSYVVGENGPELFVPKSNGTIISNTQVKSFQESSNQELLEKIDKLIQAVANGAVVNVQATRENTKEITQVISNNTNMIRVQNRVGIK